MSVEVLLGIALAIAGALGLSSLRGWSDKRKADTRLDRAQEAAQEAERRAQEARAAALRAEALREREREQAAAQEDLDDGLQKIDDDLPGAVADALRDARSRGGGDAS